MSDQRGFTLLELLIALSLFAVVIASAYAAFVNGMNAVPRGEAIAERSARLRAATSIVAKQVRSLVNYPARTAEDEVFSYFFGDPYWFSFVTASPQHNGGEGLGWVTYWSDGRTLVMAERLIFSMESLAGAADPSGQTVLLDGLTATRFQYLRLEGDESAWLDAWDSLEEQGLPAAVRVTLEGLNLGQSYWVEEIPVMTVAYGLGTYDPEVAVQEQSDLAEDADEDEEDDG